MPEVGKIRTSWMSRIRIYFYNNCMRSYYVECVPLFACNYRQLFPFLDQSEWNSGDKKQKPRLICIFNVLTYCNMGYFKHAWTGPNDSVPLKVHVVDACKNEHYNLHLEPFSNIFTHTCSSQPPILIHLVILPP